MGDTAKAQALIDFADGDLEKLYQSTPSRLQELPFAFNEQLLFAANAYVYGAGVWLDEATRTLSTFEETDPNTIIDELGRRVDVIAQRRTGLMNRGFGKASAAESGVKEFVDQVRDRLNTGAKAAPVVIVLLILAYLLFRSR